MKPSVTLCMIVKDETHIIEECLKSMAKYVDRYDITDTGSTDGTQDLIKKTMEELGVTGEVYQSDWKGFGDHAGKIGSRTESLINAKKGGADYAWVIDADDYIVGDFKFPESMDLDGYALQIGREEFMWWRNQIFKLSSGWSYKGILHEYAFCEKPKEETQLGRIAGNYRINARTQGNRNVGITPIEKYTRDAEVLKNALVDEPTNDRYQFYLAQSYFDSQQWEKSYDAYSKRIEMGGWPEEVYYSYLRCAIIKGIQEKPIEEVAAAFLDAFNARPTRAEPLWYVSRLYRQNNKPAVAYIYANMALNIPYPKDDILFIQSDVYKWGILDEIGATAFYANQPHVGYHACKRLIEEKIIPEPHYPRIMQNFRSYENVLKQHHANLAVQEMKEKEEAKMIKKQQKMNNKNTNKKSTKVPQRTGFKKRSK